MGLQPPKEKYAGRCTPERWSKIEAGYRKSLDLSVKNIECPYCGYKIEVFFGTAGLFRSLCPRCKGMAIVDVQTWRRATNHSLLSQG